MNFSSFLTTLRNRLTYGERINPARDWLILLGLGLILVAAVIGWNVWAFDTVANGGVIGSNATSTPTVFNRSSLDTIHAIFDSRAAEEEKYQTGVYTYSDPSQ